MSDEVADDADDALRSRHGGAEIPDPIIRQLLCACGRGLQAYGRCFVTSAPKGDDQPDVAKLSGTE